MGQSVGDAEKLLLAKFTIAVRDDVKHNILSIAVAESVHSWQSANKV